MGRSLNELAIAAYETAKVKGWHERDIPIPESLALIHSEVSEALECYRVGELDLHVTPEGKPIGLPSEMADVVIRVLHFCAYHGIDIEGVVEKKMAFNKLRTFRHGGKLA